MKQAKYALIMLFITLAGAGRTQTIEVSPDPLCWGNDFTVTYRIEPGGRFSQEDSVFVFIAVQYENQSYDRIFNSMERISGGFRYQGSIKKDWSFLSFYFMTRKDFDTKAMHGVPVMKTKNMPARNAFAQNMISPSFKPEYMAWFDKEMVHYPDNHAAYMLKWFASSLFQRDSLRTIVGNDIHLLESGSGPVTEEKSASLAYGYSLLGNELRSRQTILEMIRKWPEHPLTGAAISKYEYQVYTQRIEGNGPKEMTKAKWILMQTHPNLRFCRMEAANLSREKAFPLRAMEAICLPWLKEESRNPRPYLNLAHFYMSHQVKLEKASDYVQRGLSLLHRGALREYEDISGKMTGYLLFEGYLLSAELDLTLGRFSSALSGVKNSQAFQISADPRPYLMEAEIWDKLANPASADEALRNAWKKGSQEAVEKLRTRYEKRHGNLIGFEEYLNDTQETETGELRPAPDFTVKTLEGKSIEMQKLRGSVVVLNFWSLGCGPCKAEIPDLNSLVENYRDREVVFLAVTSDEADDVHSYIAEHPFRYKIVPDRGDLYKAFGVKAFPTHVLINKKGRIDTICLGASQSEQLKYLVDRLLREEYSPKR